MGGWVSVSVSVRVSLSLSLCPSLSLSLSLSENEAVSFFGVDTKMCVVLFDLRHSLYHMMTDGFRLGFPVNQRAGR